MATIRRVSLHNQAAPGANTNIFTAINPKSGTNRMRVSICLAVSSVLNLRSDDGVTGFDQGLNASNALNAGDLYEFEWSTIQSNTYSLRVETDGVIQTCIVDDIVEDRD